MVLLLISLVNDCKFTHNAFGGFALKRQTFELKRQNAPESTWVCTKKAKKSRLRNKIFHTFVLRENNN